MFQQHRHNKAKKRQARLRAKHRFSSKEAMLLSERSNALLPKKRMSVKWRQAEKCSKVLISNMTLPISDFLSRASSLGNLPIHRQCLWHFYLVRAINIKNKENHLQSVNRDTSIQKNTPTYTL